MKCFHPFALGTKNTMWHEYYRCASCYKIHRHTKKSNFKAFKKK